jgi:hypothetical protein
MVFFFRSPSEEHPSRSISMLFPLMVFGTYFAGALVGILHWGISITTTMLLAGLLLLCVAVTSEFLCPVSRESTETDIFSKNDFHRPR